MPPPAGDRLKRRNMFGVDSTAHRQQVPGSGIRIMPHSGAIPQQITVTNNTIMVEGDSNGIAAEGVHHIGIRDNDITLVDPAPSGTPGLP